jgi:hypothetical protein
MRHEICYDHPDQNREPEGLENAQDVELLGTALGSQLRHTPAQSTFDFTLHDNSISRTLCTILIHVAHMVV